MDFSELSNEELREMLVERGVNPGPIVATTRNVYEGKLAKLMQKKDAGEATEEPVPAPMTRTRSGGSPKKLVEPEEDNGDRDETYEGEESSRTLEPHVYTMPLRGRLYPDLPNHSLRPAEWFESTGVSRRSVTSARTATPSQVYNGVPPSGTGESGSGRMMWVKLAVFLVVAIFIFMLLKRVTEGGEKGEFDEKD